MNFGNETDSLTFTADMTSPSQHAILEWEEQLKAKQFKKLDNSILHKIQRKSQNTQNSSTNVGTILQIQTQSVYVNSQPEQGGAPQNAFTLDLQTENDEYKIQGRYENKPFPSFRPQNNAGIQLDTQQPLQGNNINLEPAHFGETIEPYESQPIINEVRHTTDNSPQNRENFAPANINTQQQVITISATQANLNHQEILKPETKIYLVKAICLYLILIVISVYIVLMNYMDILPFDGIFGIIFCSFLVVGLLDICWTFKVVGETWPDSVHSFTFQDKVTGLIATGSLYLRYIQVFPICTFICCCFLIGFCFIMFNLKKARHPILQAALRFYYIIQSLLITLKIDSNINWKWEIVFIPTLLYCVTTNVYSFIFLIVLKKKLNDTTSLQQNASRLTKIFGFTWYSLFYGSSIVLYLGVFAISQALRSRQVTGILTVFAYIVAIINMILFIYTLLAWKYLVKFITNYDLIESHLLRLEAGRPRIENKIIRFEVEEKEVYFEKVSATYFVPLYKKPVPKANEDSNKTTKTSIIGVKLRKTVLDPQNSRRETKTERPTFFEDLKESLSGRYTFRQKKDVKAIYSTRVADTSMWKYNKAEQDIPVTGEKTLRGKLMLTENNGTESKRLQSPAQSKEDENLCHICYASVADAVLVDCGHGGMCYGCATAFTKQKDQCTQCRKKVEAIYKIDPNPKFSNIVKGVEVSKVIVEIICP